MRNAKIYGRLATEGIEAAAIPEGAEPEVAAPVEAGADSLEAELVEVNDGLVEIQADEVATDTAAEVVEEMEVVVESLRVTAQNGGLCKGGADILNKFQASWNRRLGLEDNHGTLSSESFGGTNSRAGQTSLAAESIKEKAQSVWKAIVEMFKKAVAAIGAVWNRIFDGATRLKARADNLAKAAGSVNGSATAQTFENQTLAANLHINGTVDVKAAATAIVAEAGELVGLTERSIKFAETAMSSMTGPAHNNTDNTPESLTAIVSAAKALVTTGFSKVADAASVGITQPEHTELFKGKALPGNKAVIAIVPTVLDPQDDNVGVSIGKSAIKMGIFDASKKPAEKAALKTLTPQEVAGIAKQMGDAAGKVLAYKAEQKKAEDTAKKMVAMCEKLSSENAKNAAAEDGVPGALGKLAGWSFGKIGQGVSKTAVSLVLNSAPQIVGYVLNAGGSVLQYGEQSLKQYGKPAAAKAEPAAAAA